MAEAGIEEVTHRNQIPLFMEKIGLCGAAAEIGVWKGDFSNVILRNWRGKQLTLVDAWKAPKDYKDRKNLSDADFEHVHRSVVRRYRGNERVVINRNWSIDAANDFPPFSLDWVYIDANHSLEAVVQDLKTWYPKVKPGGFLTGHDYCHYQDHISLIEVKKAVDMFAEVYSMDVHTTQEFCPSWMMQIPAASIR